MKSKTIIFFALVFLIFTAGCLFNKQPGVSEPEKIGYRTGTYALQMSFLKNFPPDQVKEGQEFQAIIEAKNQGAYDIENLNLILTGLKEETTEVIGETRVFVDKLPGKSINYPEGSKETITFKLKNIKRLAIDKHTELIKIDACYAYETTASADICINPTSYLTSAKGQAGCIDKTTTLSGGQGAPVAITKIEQTTNQISVEEGRYEIELKIHISNAGKGFVFNSEGCKQGGVLEIKDIGFSNFKLNQNINCKELTDNNLFKLEQKDNILTCTAEIQSSTGSFTTPMTIKLGYFYQDSLEKTIEIIKK